MLKLAYNYLSELNNTYREIVFDDKYKFYNTSGYWTYELTIGNCNWSELDFVSVDKNDKILGYLGAGIDRNLNKIDYLRVLNFSNKDNIIFSKDLYKFIIDLFIKFNFRKIEFNVTVGNPIERMYDKYCLKYGGRIVGVKKQDVKLQDGKYYDNKLYEIFREDFVKNYKNYKGE